MVEKSHSHFSESNFFNEIKGWPKLFLTRRPPQFSFTLLPSFSVITFVIPMTFTTPQSVLFSLILFFEKFNFSCKSSCHSLSALLCTFWAYMQDYFRIYPTFDSTVFKFSNSLNQDMTILLTRHLTKQCNHQCCCFAIFATKCINSEEEDWLLSGFHNLIYFCKCKIKTKVYRFCCRHIASKGRK